MSCVSAQRVLRARHIAGRYSSRVDHYLSSASKSPRFARTRHFGIRVQCEPAHGISKSHFGGAPPRQPYWRVSFTSRSPSSGTAEVLDTFLHPSRVAFILRPDASRVLREKPYSVPTLERPAIDQTRRRPAQSLAPRLAQPAGSSETLIIGDCITAIRSFAFVILPPSDPVATGEIPTLRQLRD